MNEKKTSSASTHLSKSLFGLIETQDLPLLKKLLSTSPGQDNLNLNAVLGDDKEKVRSFLQLFLF
jgi:hypothetical protein